VFFRSIQLNKAYLWIFAIFLVLASACSQRQAGVARLIQPPAETATVTVQAEATEALPTLLPTT
jgi:hypothetical protein